MAKEMEGSWEEIASHASELAGHRVHLTILEDEEKPSVSASTKSTPVDLLDRPGVIPPKEGMQPVKDLDAFLASLPRFTPEEADTLWQAIEENRAMRRAVAQEKTE